MIQKFSGINIQYPISELIINNKKVIETRTYPPPKRFIGHPIILIETPGTNGNFKARMRALIQFDEGFEYKSKAEFYRDSNRHCVTPKSAWAWSGSQPKWGWPVRVLKVFKQPLPVPKRTGIKYTSDIPLDLDKLD